MDRLRVNHDADILWRQRGREKIGLAGRSNSRYGGLAFLSSSRNPVSLYAPLVVRKQGDDSSTVVLSKADPDENNDVELQLVAPLMAKKVQSRRSKMRVMFAKKKTRPAFITIEIHRYYKRINNVKE